MPGYRPPGAGDDPDGRGSRLREFRMSMLGHGFVDEDDGDGFMTDETEPVAYGVVRLGRGSPRWIVAVVVVIVIAIVAVLLI